MGLTQSDVKPEPGDLIEIFRGSIQHWAVYVGDGYVVHLVPYTPLSNKAEVKMEKLWDVVGDDEWKINNDMDRKYKPREGDIIVKEARDLVGKELLYSLIGRNCEHFANELRYGRAESRQVLKALAAGPAHLIGGLLLGSSSASSSKKARKK